VQTSKKKTHNVGVTFFNGTCYFSEHLFAS
jgi:hypothetical protein